MKSWANEAGLPVVASTAGVWTFSSADDVAWWSGLWSERVTSSSLAEQAQQRGLATAQDLDRIAAGWRTWGESGDAWFVVLHGELICTPARTA